MTWTLNQDGAWELRRAGQLLGGCWIRGKGREEECWVLSTYHRIPAKYCKAKTLAAAKRAVEEAVK